MRKLLIATILILGLSTLPSFAQEIELPTEPGGEEMQIQIQEEETEDQEQTEDTEQDEETETLSEELQVQETQDIGFLTILFAVITPALLIAVAYMLIKMSNQ
jgi:hypothetical protein